MSVVIETTLGDITVDLFLSERPRACLNFLKLCKIKYYNFNLFHTISRSFMAQTGDPTGSRSGGESIFGILDGPSKRFFEGENEPRIKHTKMGLISFVGNEERMIGSQFFLTLGEDLTYLDEKHCVFGEVVEGFDILEMINEVICDTDDRPYQDVRITHTVILDDPYPDPRRLVVPSRSPSPTAERLQGGRIAPDEEIDEMEGRAPEEIAEIQAAREAKARATILEMVGDLPDADMAPPENVLFVCKLNPVTSDDDLEIIFSRFGKIKSCEVIRDKKTGDSLQYAFVEFEDQKSCENAYFKMDNVLIDDRRIHVDFSQSVSKIKWHGKGRGVTHYDDKGRKSKDNNNDIGKGNYKSRDHNVHYKKDNSGENNRSPKQIRNRSRSPSSQDTSKRIKHNSPSPSRDKNRSRRERDKSFKRKDFLSPERSGVKTSSRENHKKRERNEVRSGKNHNSLSPKLSSRSPTPRKNRYVSRSPRRSRGKSISPNSKSQDRKKSRTPRRNRGMSPSPSERSRSRNYTENVRKRKDSRSRSPNKNNYQNVTSKYNKTVPSSSRIKHYTPERKNVYVRSEKSTSVEKNKTKVKDSKSEIESEKKEKKKKKKRDNSSEDSDSDGDKKLKKVKKYNSSSSDSEDYHKKKSKKNKRKKKRSDSEESVNYKKSKSKKKERKSDSD